MITFMETPVPKLKYKKKTIIHVDYSDLEQFINGHFACGNKYCFVSTEECGNDTSHEYEVDDKYGRDYDEREANEVAEKLSRGSTDYNYVTGDILNYLCVGGYIPKGLYIVRVVW